MRRRRRKKIPLDEAYRLLNPLPVVLVSTLLGERPNLSTVAWIMPIDYYPPVVGMVLGGSATSRAIERRGEWVVNIPHADMADIVRKAGEVSGDDEDKFALLDLTPLPSLSVKTPGIAECMAHLECRLIEKRTEFGKKARSAYGLYLGEVLEARADPAFFEKYWLVTKGARLLHHLGGGIFE